MLDDRRMSQRVEDLCTKLAGWIASVKVDDQALFAKARVLLTDAVTLAVAARGSASASALEALIAHDGGPVTAWGSGKRSGPMSAVLANALLAHERFQDDCEMRSWTHPGSFVVPAAIAGAEMAETSFEKALEAIAVGYAVTAWLGAEEVVALSLMKRGFRCSPTLAPFAAAAAFARGLACEAHSTAAAISAAALLGRGTLQSVAGGGEDWRWQNATAARDGISVVLAARTGMRGGREALEGPHGFLSTYCDLHAIPDRWRELPALSDIHAVWHKEYPTLGDNMAAAVAASLASKRLPIEVDISSVRVAMPTRFWEFPGTQRRPPFRSSTEAIASVPFTVALALRHGEVKREHYDAFEDESINRLARVVHVTGDDSLRYTEARLDVTLADGTEIHISPADIPQTEFFRDEEAAVAAAARLLGPEGAQIAELLLHAPLDQRVSDVLSRATSVAP